MINGLKVASLFLGYGLVGLGGEYAVEFFADMLRTDAIEVRHQVHVEAEPAVEDEVEPRHEVEVVVEVEPRVEVERRVEVHVEPRVRPEPRVDVQVSVGNDRCRFQVDRDFSIAASADDVLALSAGSGELRVEGRHGLEEVRGSARICASDEAYLDDLDVTLDRSGERLELSAHYPDRSDRRGWRGENYARIDLVVEVPLDMAVDIDDSSGSMEVHGTGALRINDSSGSIDVRGINGPLSIRDSSGDVDVDDIAGDVDIEDGSGSLSVRDVEGSVTLRDGSGSIEVEEVERDVIVERDGSGSIRVRDVRGDFSVGRDGSGGIRHSGVDGRVDIPEDRRKRRRRGG